MTTNLCRLSLWVFFSLCTCVSVLQPVTPPTGSLMSKQRAQLTFDPCMFRQLRETDWFYHTQTETYFSSWHYNLGDSWFRKQISSAFSFFLNLSPLFLCAFVCIAFRPDADANPLFAELWRGWSIQGDRGGVSSSAGRGKEQTGIFKTTEKVKLISVPFAISCPSLA